jgi:hypothetical protein
MMFMLIEANVKCCVQVLARIKAEASLQGMLPSSINLVLELLLIT